MDHQIPVNENTYQLTVRRIEEQDTAAVSRLVCRNLREVNSKDYGQEAAEQMCARYDEARVSYLASIAHMYVILQRGTIVACGAISSYWGNRDESMIPIMFVQPELQGHGLGRKIMETLEQDEYFVRARRVEVSASVSSCEFYQKFGYRYKRGRRTADRNGAYLMEKFKTCG